MEKCKVYKGLDSPCKIKGLISKYFYFVFLGALVGAVFMCMSISSFFQTGDKLSFFMDLFVVIVLLITLYWFFYKRSNLPKINKDRITATITNRDLYIALNKKKHG